MTSRRERNVERCREVRSSLSYEESRRSLGQWGGFVLIGFADQFAVESAENPGEPLATFEDRSRAAAWAKYLAARAARNATSSDRSRQ